MADEVTSAVARVAASLLKPGERVHVLAEGGVLEALGAGCVLTGGGAMLPGMLDITESQLRVPARTGLPVRLSQLPGGMVHPSFSVAIGMILYANRTRSNLVEESTTWRSRVRAAFAGSF